MAEHKCGMKLFFNSLFYSDIYYNNDELSQHVVGIYGWPQRENKHRTWEIMGRIKSMSRAPCIMFGDFFVSIKEGGGSS